MNPTTVNDSAVTLPLSGSGSAPAPRPVALSAWCIVAAFGTYFCMYAFRKPFTAGTYSDVILWGVGYKTVLVTSQVLGYMLSKFIGIKVIAEMKPERRALGILVLIGIAEAALLLFGLVPPPFNFLLLFLNGLPLGMVFGLVLGFLEGRRMTEALTAGLCASFIVASGAVKSVGVYLLVLGVSEYWMPFFAGLVFVPPLLIFVWMLGRIPPPSAEDVARRSERAPMSRAERWRFFWTYALGLSALVAAYVLITILRSIRDDFAVEIWHDLGHTGEPAIFTQSEMLVMLGVVVINGAAIFIVNNRSAFFASLGISLFGLILAATALTGLEQGWLGAFPFMVLLGLGLYLPYVAVHTTVFERMIALVRDRGNIGYLMYLADAFGYLGYVAVMLGNSFFPVSGNHLNFFMTVSWSITLGAGLLVLLTWLYFATRTAKAF